MYTILKRETLTPVTKLMDIAAPHVAHRAAAGQFVIVRIDEFGERIPLTIADYDREKGSITIIFQELGKSTIHLGNSIPAIHWHPLQGLSVIPRRSGISAR